MYILGIDTSSNMLIVSLSDDNRIITEYHSDKQMGLLQNLAPSVDNVLYENSLTSQDIGAVAVSLGPGSFTGLRIGVAFAKTLAYSLDIPIIGVPTLKAMAKGACGAFGDYICPLIFARVDEVYCAAFTGDMKDRVIDYSFMTIDEILGNPIFKDKKVIFLGTGAQKHRDLIKEKLPLCIVLDENYNFAKGFAINEIGFEELQKGNRDNVKTLTPMYIKKPTPVIRKEKGII